MLMVYEIKNIIAFILTNGKFSDHNLLQVTTTIVHKPNVHNCVYIAQINWKMNRDKHYPSALSLCHSLLLSISNSVVICIACNSTYGMVCICGK